MPFPWKKSKMSRISRMVSDLNKNSKRNGSLVVETGFPTSLIDLFVKNNDRLRRSSRRKSNPEILLSDPTRLFSPPPPPPCNQERETQSGEFVSITRDSDDSDDKKNKKRIELRLVFKISLVVVLAVSTRNLAIWVMMVAFLFMGFESFGSGFSGFLKSGSNELILERVDMERVEREVNELLELEDGLKLEAILTNKQQPQQGVERSRSSRIKSSIIKKLVPKKLRNKKNQGESEKETQVSETESETEVMVPITSYKNDQILPQQQVESAAEKGKKNLSKGNSGYVILFVVILAGLIGGKGFALLLTLLCCLMIRIYIRTRKSDADLDIGRKTR